MTVAQQSAHTYIRFNPNPLKLEEWRHHLNLTPTPESPDAIFARALPLFQSAKDSLLKHGWSEVGPLPPGMLFIVQSPLQSRRQPDFPPMFGIPSELSAFIEYQEHLHEWLYSGVLTACPEGITISSPADAKSQSRRQYEDDPITSMFNLLQLLVVGMFLIVQDERDEVGTFRTCRALPSVDWMMQHEQYLNWVFGEGYFDLLARRARECPLTAQYIPDAGWWD